jgi:hypothetical protein
MFQQLTDMLVLGKLLRNWEKGLVTSTMLSQSHDHHKGKT